LLADPFDVLLADGLKISDSNKRVSKNMKIELGEHSFGINILCRGVHLLLD
jgi:hypothetical protein